MPEPLGNSSTPSGRVVLFDILGTVVHDPVEQELPDFFGLTAAQLMGRPRHPSAWPDFELDRITETRCLELLFAGEAPFEHAALKRAMRAAYRWQPGMESLLARLCAAGHELHALSNYPRWYELIEERLRLSRYLRWSFVSCNTGHRKPSPEAFLGAARALQRAPRELVFVDDREANCAAARALDFDAVRFESAEALESELRRRGLLAPAS